MLLVGAQLQRYYKGTKIILVRKREASIIRSAPTSAIATAFTMRREAGGAARAKPPRRS